MNMAIIDKKMYDFSLSLKKWEKKGKISILYDKQEIKDNIEKSILLPLFYHNLSGLIVKKESRMICFTNPIILDDKYMLFAIMNEIEKICFDMNTLNEANEWNIINYGSKYVITKTLSSFLNNKLWAWIDRGRFIWNKEYYID